MARLASILLLLGLIAMLLTACGGDQRRGEAEVEETTTTPSAVTGPESSGGQAGEPQITQVTDPARRAYVDQVDAICRRLDPERAKGREEVRTAATSVAAANVYEGSIAAGWRELREIEAVPEPPGEAALLKADIFDPIRAQLALKAQIREALAVADVPSLRRLRTELDNSSRSLTGFARGYGFRICGEA